VPSQLKKFPDDLPAECGLDSRAAINSASVRVLVEASTIHFLASAL
jgi:hypothetical protein